MSAASEALFLRLLDLARKQKAAVEAGNLEEALSLADGRQRLLLEIQKLDGAGRDGKPAFPAAVIRQVLSIDAEAASVARGEMQETSLKLGKINTFKTCCQGIVDEARFRSPAPTR